MLTLGVSDTEFRAHLIEELRQPRTVRAYLFGRETSSSPRAGAQLRGGAERIGDASCRALVVGGKRDPDMTIVEDGVVRPVGLLDLVERLRDQKRFQSIPGP